MDAGAKKNRRRAASWMKKKNGSVLKARQAELMGVGSEAVDTVVVVGRKTRVDRRTVLGIVRFFEVKAVHAEPIEHIE